MFCNRRKRCSSEVGRSKLNSRRRNILGTFSWWEQLVCHVGHPPFYLNPGAQSIKKKVTWLSPLNPGPASDTIAKVCNSFCSASRSSGSTPKHALGDSIHLQSVWLSCSLYCSSAFVPGTITKTAGASTAPTDCSDSWAWSFTSLNQFCSH